MNVHNALKLLVLRLLAVTGSRDEDRAVTFMLDVDEVHKEDSFFKAGTGEIQLHAASGKRTGKKGKKGKKTKKIDGKGSDPTVTSHKPICEDIGREMDANLKNLSDTPFTEEELNEARELSQINRATKNGPRIALWLMGPAGAGKSYAISKSSLEGLGLQRLSGSNDWDAVIVDGDFYREVSKNLKKIAAEGFSHATPCIWRGGWGGEPKRQSKVEKFKLYDDAMEQGSNLLIPLTQGKVDMVEKLKSLGYINHVKMIIAEPSKVNERRRSRGDKTGRCDEVSDFEASWRDFVPMIAAINGGWEVIDTTDQVTSVARGNGGNSTGMACLSYSIEWHSKGFKAENLPQDCDHL